MPTNPLRSTPISNGSRGMSPTQYSIPSMSSSPSLLNQDSDLQSHLSSASERHADAAIPLEAAEAPDVTQLGTKLETIPERFDTDVHAESASPLGGSEATSLPRLRPDPHEPKGMSSEKSNEQTSIELDPVCPGYILQPRWKQYMGTYLLFLATFVCVVGTICYLFISSSSHPLVLSKPATTIFILNLATTVSVFLMSEMINQVFESLRWNLVARRTGAGIATFLSLGGGTSLLGVVRLMLSNQKVGHRKWCGQRIILIAIRIALPIVLLANLDFETIYPRATPDHDIIAGVAPFNITYAVELGSLENVMVPEYFVLFLAGLLRDPKVAFPAAPITDACINSGDDCLSYVLPGDFSQISAYTNDPNNLTLLPDLPHGNAAAYIVQNVLVHQLEFFPVQNTNSTSFLNSDCRIYGNSVLGSSMKVCMRNEGNDLIAGWLACPLSVAEQGLCFSDPAPWNSSFNTTIQLHVSQFFTQVVYNVANDTIQNIATSADPIPSPYAAQDILQIYDVALHVSADPDLLTNSTLAYQVLAQAQTVMFTYIIGLIDSTSVQGLQTGIEYELFRNFLAVPLYTINYNKLRTASEPLPPNLSYMMTTGYFGSVLYRVVIAKYSLYTFTVLGTCTLLWCGGILLYCRCSGTITPNVSQYPELDLASKCTSTPAETERGGMETVLDGLGNSNSGGFEKRIKGKKLFVGTPKDFYGSEHIMMTSQPGWVTQLLAGKRYR